MKIEQHIDVESLVSLLRGETTYPNVNVWRSQLRALSKAISFVENNLLLAPQILGHKSLSHMVQNQGRVVGITGLPGAGKSSLTNLLVKELRARGKSVAVFAIDPSSRVSGGAILGDRVRMQDHFRDEKVFIRSMGARGALGGIAQATRSAIRLANLLNFDFILVETVGIGQSESDIVDIADTTCLVLMPHSGDEIQLMKAGVLQLANIYIVNKCDLADASRMVQELKENTMPSEKEAWCPPIVKTSVAKGEGISDVIESVFAHEEFEKIHPQGQEQHLSRVRREILHNMIFIATPSFEKILAGLSEEELKTLVRGETTAMFMASRALQGILSP